MMIRYVAGLFAGIRALVRAYDDESGLSPEGLPMLVDWQGHDPYEAFRVKGHRDVSPYGALVFLSGSRLGSNILLDSARTSVGTVCDADVVIQSKQLNESLLTISREGKTSIVRSDQPNSGLAVNGHKTYSAEIFDQDEIEFLGIKMVYVELEHV